MIGLIFKITGFFAALIIGALVIMNITNVWNPGTLSWTAPDEAICDRYAQANFKGREIQLQEVRWIMTMKDYGWGCYWEFGNFDVVTVTPMPEI